MKTIRLDISNIHMVRALHIYLAYMLELPAHYGKNLDALFDLLTERSEETLIEIENFDSLRKRFGIYADAFLDTISDASKENKKVTFRLI